jgi:hypothetical protein
MKTATAFKQGERVRIKKEAAQWFTPQIIKETNTVAGEFKPESLDDLFVTFALGQLYPIKAFVVGNREVAGTYNVLIIAGNFSTTMFFEETDLRSYL